MNVLCPYQIRAVIALARRCQVLLHESDGHVQEYVQIRNRLPERPVLHIENPLSQPLSLLRIREFGALIGDIRIDIPVQQDHLSFCQFGLYLIRSGVPVLGEQKCHELWVHGIVRTKLATQESRYQVSVDRRLVTWKMYVLQLATPGCQIFP